MRKIIATCILYFLSSHLLYAQITVPYKACVTNHSAQTVYFTVSSVYRSIAEKTSAKFKLPAHSKLVCGAVTGQIDPASVQYGIYQIRVDIYQNKQDTEPHKTDYESYKPNGQHFTYP